MDKKIVKNYLRYFPQSAPGVGYSALAAPILTLSLRPFENFRLTKIMGSLYTFTRAGVTANVDAIFLDITNHLPFTPPLDPLSAAPVGSTETPLRFMLWKEGPSVIELDLAVKENLTIQGGGILNAQFAAGDGLFIGFILEFSYLESKSIEMGIYES